MMRDFILSAICIAQLVLITYLICKERETACINSEILQMFDEAAEYNEDLWDAFCCLSDLYTDVNERYNKAYDVLADHNLLSEVSESSTPLGA